MLVPVVGFHAGAAPRLCAIDTELFGPCTSPLSLPGLAEGDHIVRVRATDRAGNVESEPAQRLFEIDRTPPDTTITSAPAGPFHEGEGFSFHGTEDGPFECAIDARPYVRCTSGVQDLIGVPPGEHTFSVRAYDAAGNVDPTPASAPFTFTDAAPVAALTVSPDEGPANLEVQTRVSATDADTDRLDYELDYGDGTVLRGDLPEADPRTHTYGRAGRYVVRLEVSDGYVSDVVTHDVTVVLPEPLQANAGDDLVVVAGEPARLDGGGSRPLAGIESHGWTFGDGAADDGEIVDHVYGAPGTYEATLTVKAGVKTSSDTTAVTVLPAGAALGVHVLVTSGGMPLAGTDVLVTTPGGQRISAVTDGFGSARLRGLGDGEQKVLAYAPAHLPGGKAVTVKDGAGEVSIELRPGAVASATLNSHRMTYQEILDAGIDPNDPANQHVFEFTVNLQVKDPVTGETTSGGGGGYAGGSGGFIGTGTGGLTCRRLVCKGTVNGSTVFVAYHEIAPGVPSLTTLVIPFRARWLKEFFDITMTVNNLADPDFVLSNGSAMLELPPGLSLAPTARGEALTQPVGDIPGGSSGSMHWVVRGDIEGEYRLNAVYGATLEPFGRRCRCAARWRIR